LTGKGNNRIAYNKVLSEFVPNRARGHVVLRSDERQVIVVPKRESVVEIVPVNCLDQVCISAYVSQFDFDVICGDKGRIRRV